MARARKLAVLIAAGVFAGLLATSAAREPEVSSTPAGGPSLHEERPPRHHRGRHHEEMRKRIEQLPPDQRERFRKNLERWQALPPEQRERLRERHERKFKEMQEEAEEALAKSGLQLEGERRARFIRRYMRQRREIEEAVRQEADALRKAKIEQLIERLKAEAASPQPER